MIINNFEKLMLFFYFLTVSSTTHPTLNSFQMASYNPSRKSAVYSILPDIFLRYREHGFQFLFVENYNGTGKEGLLVVAPDEISEVELDWKITRRIEKFEDIPEAHYKEMVEPILDDLVLAIN